MGIQSSEGERQVSLGEIPEDQAVDSLKKNSLPLGFGQDAIPKGLSEGEIDASRYSFKSGHGVVSGNIVIHFYLPKHAKMDSPEAKAAWQKYWLQKFPQVVDRVAQKYFEAGPPRLSLKYTEELVSWWFCARGFGVLLDPGAFCAAFLDLLDEELKKKSEDGNGTQPEDADAGSQ